MDLESATDELFGMLPSEFTAARNAKAAEARKAGLADVAASLKELRKPSAGAWLANLLVRERPKDIASLMQLGDGLRTRGANEGATNPEGLEAEVDASSKLIRHAKLRASRTRSPGFSVGGRGLEMTLDAAFADPQAATQLRQGRLTTGLRYSGLGLTRKTDPGTPARAKGSGSARDSSSGAQRMAASRDLDKANREAERADAQVEKARQAVKEERRH